VSQRAADSESQAPLRSRQRSTAQSANDSGSSERLNTPSTSNASYSASVAPGEHVNPDEALPSIETMFRFGASLSPDRNSALRARSPSFSFTPPTSEERTVFTPSSTSASGGLPAEGRASSQVSSLNGRIAALGISRDNTPRQSLSRGEASFNPGSGHDHSSTTPDLNPDGGNAAPSPSVRGLTAGMATIGLGPDDVPSRTHLSPQSPSPAMVMGDMASSPGSTSRRRSSSHVNPTPHNVADEEPPHERFHDPDVQSQLTASKGRIDDLVYVLESSSLHNEPDSRIRALYLQAVALSQYQSPSARTVGLVGDSGVGMFHRGPLKRSFSSQSAGKTSLLNSLLDRRGFARTVGG